MPSDDVLADTDLRDSALDAVERFVRQHGCPVQRTQISGLLQIAENEPGLLKGFADKQKERAQQRHQETRRQEYEHEAEFWNLVGALCNGTPPRHPWSLDTLMSREVPDDLRAVNLPPGARLSGEEQKARSQRAAARNAFVAGRRAILYPAFFRHFCAEYLYRKARQGQGGEG